MWDAYFCMGGYKRDMVVVIKMGAYIHRMLILCGYLLSRFYGILVVTLYLQLQQCKQLAYKTDVAAPDRNRIMRISSASPSLTRYSAKLPLGVGLIRTSWTYQIFMHLHSANEPHP